jgi:hypothetical protein
LTARASIAPNLIAVMRQEIVFSWDTIVIRWE